MKNKKIILFIIIVLMVLGLGYLGYSYLFNNKVKIDYKFSEKSAEGEVLKVDVSSKKEIKEVVLPDGTTKKINKEDGTVEYLVTKNGDYTFTIILKDGNKEEKTISVANLGKTTTTKEVTTKKSTNPTTTKKVSYIGTATTKKTSTKTTTTTTRKALSSENKLKSLSVLGKSITLVDGTTEYYYYYSGSEVNPNVLYATKSAKASASANTSNMVVGDNLYTINVTAEDGSKLSYKLHVVKYEVNITFTNTTNVSNTTINTKADTGLNDALKNEIVSIKFAVSSSPISPAATETPYTDYDSNVGINITETGYVYIIVTTKDGNTFTKTSPMYTIDTVAPVISQFANVGEDNKLGGDNGLLESANATISITPSLNTSAFVKTNETSIPLNLSDFTYHFTINATDNNVGSLVYSNVVSNAPITDSTTGWSEWSTSNQSNASVEPYSGNDYYFGFKVKDAAGNISEVTYSLPTFKKDIGSDKCYLKSEDPVLKVVDANTSYYDIYLGTLMFKNTEISLVNPTNLCVISK